MLTSTVAGMQLVKLGAHDIITRKYNVASNISMFFQKHINRINFEKQQIRIDISVKGKISNVLYQVGPIYTQNFHQSKIQIFIIKQGNLPY